MRRAWILWTALAAAPAPQETRTATALLGEAAKFESEGRASAIVIDQLAVEVAKLDAKLQEIEAKRKQLLVDSEKSEATKDRLAPVIAELDASRRPLDVQKTRLEQERSRLLDRRLLERALEAFRKAAEQAAAEPGKANLAPALLGIGRVGEIVVPENIAEAQAAYARIVAECADQKDAAAHAARKIRLRGIDVYLDQFARFVAEWRDVLRNSPGTLEAKRKDWEAKIRALGRDAMEGLVDGLGHKDEMVRAFAAEMIAGTADEKGLTLLISKLADPSPLARAGAGIALARVFEAWSSARALDQEADKVIAELEVGDPEDPDVQRFMASTRDRANEIKRKAAAIRGNLPVSLGNTAEIEKALDLIISDEAAQPLARVEAAKALRSLGEISGGLIDSLHNGMKSRNRAVREACCAAAAAVDPSNLAGRQKLAARLMEIVQYEPEADPRPMAERDLSNDNAVRESAAISLAAIGLVTAVPALAEAMADGDAGVRRTAHEAVKRITGLDLAYEADPAIAGKSAEEVAKAQAEKRKEGIDRWMKWWNETLGSGVLVDRFWQFQSKSKGGDPARLYDQEEFLREIRNRAYTLADPAAYLERAQKAVERFHAGKNRVLQEAVSLGAPAIDKFAALLSGAVPADERLTPELQAKSRAVTRMFVAETVAKLVAAANAADKAADLRGRVASGSKDEKAGAALALGFLPRTLLAAEDRETLERRGLEDPDAEVREAASRALGRVGTPENGPALAKVAAANSATRAGEAAQLAALRALVALAPAHEEVVKTCGELAGDEGSRRATSFAVREAACDVLAAVAAPAAVKNLWLFRARRDIAKPVRDAASRAIAAVAAADPSIPEAIAAVVGDAKAKSIDRTGAALALGDLGQPKTIPALVWQIVDRNPPQALRATDPVVRAICAESLGAMGGKARYRLVGEKLVDALADPSELVQGAAIEALRKVAPAPPPGDAFRVKDPAAAKAAGIARLREWLETNREAWPEMPQ